MLADFQNITGRTDCDRPEFVRTYVLTAGVCRPGKLPQHRRSQCRVMQSTGNKANGMQGGRVAHRLCEVRAPPVFSPAQPESFFLVVSLTKELARLPKSCGTLTNGLRHHMPTGLEGELSLGRGPCSQTTHPPTLRVDDPKGIVFTR